MGDRLHLVPSRIVSHAEEVELYEMSLYLMTTRESQRLLLMGNEFRNLTSGQISDCADR